MTGSQRSIWWSSLAAVGLLACGRSTVGDPSGSGGTGGSVAANPDLVAPATVAELCATFPAAWGDLMARCYGGEAADWASRIDVPCQETARAEEAGRIALDEARLAECYAVLAGNECRFGPGQYWPACAGLVIGYVPIGQPCKPLGYGDECGPDAFCKGDGSSCAGTCRGWAGEGDICHGNYVTVDCGAGLACDGPSARCMVPRSAGETCGGPAGPCDDGLYCEVPAGREEGSCEPLKTEGPCQGAICAPGFTCLRYGDEGTCVRVKPIGSPCTVGFTECAGYCSPEGTCRVVAGEGESCAGIPCGAGLFCERLSNGIDTVCRRQLPVGAPWPDTVVRGNPCDGGDRRTFSTEEPRVCAVCTE